MLFTKTAFAKQIKHVLLDSFKYFSAPKMDPPRIRNFFDKIFMFRIGLFYPNLTSDFDMADCPPFWQTRKIEINLLNMKDEEYMDNIQVSAYIAIALDLLVGIGSIIFIWNCSNMPTVYRNSKNEVGPWSKFGFTIGKVSSRRSSANTLTVGPFTPFVGFGKVYFVITKILPGFGMPLLDTALGKCKLFSKFDRPR